MREVDLIEDRNERQSLGEGEIEVGNSLRLHALTGIDENEGYRDRQRLPISLEALVEHTTTTASITPSYLSAKVNVTRRVNQMQQVVLALVVVYHGASLGLDRDASFPLDIEPVQNLLLPSRLNSTRELQQAVGERTLAMVYVSNNTEVAITIEGDIGDALLEVGLRSEGLCISTGEVREALKGRNWAGSARLPTAQQAARGPDA